MEANSSGLPSRGAFIPKPRRRSPTQSVVARPLVRLLDLVILRLGVDAHVVDVVAQDLMGKQQPHLDRVIGVVVAEGARPADDVQPLELLEEVVDHRELAGIFQVVDGVCEARPNDVPADDVLGRDECQHFCQVAHEAPGHVVV